MSNDVLPNTPQSIIEIFKTSGKIWKMTMMPTFLFYLLTIGSSQLLNILNILFPSLNIVASDPSKPTELVFTAVILFLISIFFAISFSISTIYRTNNIIHAQNLDFGPTATYGFRKFFPVLGVSIVFGFGVLLGSLLLIIPGIIFLVYFLFSIYFVIFGNEVFASMQKSYRLVENHWLRTALILVLIYGTSFLLIFGGRVMILLSLGYYPEYNQTLTAMALVYISIFQLIIVIPISHFITCCLLVCFYDLQIRKQVSGVLA